MAISAEVRERVLAAVAAADRDLAWLARTVGKSKAWGTDFKQGRGTISHSEMRKLATALGTSPEYLWEGVTSSVTPAADIAQPEGDWMHTLTGHEQMIIAIYRQLAPSRQQMLMDMLTRLLREQTHVPVPPAKK